MPKTIPDDMIEQMRSVTTDLMLKLDQKDCPFKASGNKDTGMGIGGEIGIVKLSNGINVKVRVVVTIME
jgi:hypothetical protein